MPDGAAAARTVGMSTLTEDPPVQIDPPVQVEITAADWRHDRARREWMLIGLVLTGLVALLARRAGRRRYAAGQKMPFEVTG
jgi:hypothetical protein